MTRPAPPRPLTLHLSGPLRVLDGDGAAIDGIGQRGRALLAFLACQEGQRAERSAAADLLWSDRAEAQARASLRQELSALRRALPPDVLGADRYAVWLEPGGSEVRRTRGAPFLQGFDLASEGFEDWLRAARQRGDAAPAAPRAVRERPALAVMPFAELGVPAEDMFADGVVEEITGALGRVHDFHVVARQSAWALRGEAIDAPEAARRLGVEYVVEGSVRRAGDRVRIEVRLVRGGDGRTVWSERFDDRLDDLLDLQDRIAARVAGHLSPGLRAAEIRRAGRCTGDPSAYERMLTGLPHFWIHDPEENRRALAAFDAALAVDPAYAPALAMKAWAHAQACCYVWTDDVEGARAASTRAAAAAFAGAQDRPQALTALSAAAAMARSDFAASEALAQRALEIDPNTAWGWLRLGWAGVYLGRPEEALAQFDRAEALSPLDPFRFNMEFGRGCALRAMRRLDEAVDAIERGLRAAPAARWANRMLFGALWLAGREEEAIAAGRRWLAAHPGLSRETLRNGMVQWSHDPAYADLLHRFDELIPPG
ncbi:hypothetical protein JQC91_05420 [Jannaschia sp. Os4]|uniref:hypothetical protein n=1 Tax=Jannaschia sp. Os4 TaxID=2807617 RepID=UPI00193AA150|nr:hypothetical protein [Jannaschia sp. Os4]MBM2575739.1 hypothetical protein [Jannaschia sp. Os4]